MTKIFVSHAQEDAQCAEAIRRALEVEEHACWQDPDYPGPTAASYPPMIENAILGSASLILIWSTNAAQSEWVIRHILFAQRLKKSILPIALDSTTFPNTLIVPVTITCLASCEEAAKLLLPHLPPSDSQEPLIKLGELAAHEFIRNRKEAIDLAIEMLAHNKHHEEVLALLEYLA